MIERIVIKDAFDNAELELEFSDDLLQSQLFVRPLPSNSETSAKLELAKLVAVLGKVISPKTIIPSALYDVIKAIDSQQSLSNLVVAKARSPKKGKNGKLVLTVKPFTPMTTQSAVEVFDGRYFRVFDNVERGTIVARIYLPQNGKDGVDVKGTPLKAEAGSPAQFHFDDSLELTPPSNEQSYQQLVAQKSGFLVVDNGNYKISDHWQIPQNIDYRTGDIDFVGSITVCGEIKKGFGLSATKDLEIQGDVRGFVACECGPINIKGSIIGEQQQVVVSSFMTTGAISQAVGKKMMQVRTGGIIQAEAVENASIEAHDGVIILRDAKNSMIRTRGTLKVHGSLFGGTTFAAGGIEVGKLGSPKGNQTVLIPCSDIESSSDYADLETQLRHLVEAQQMIQLLLGPYVDNPQAIAELGGLHKQRMEALSLQYTQLTVDIHALQLKLERFKENAQFNAHFKISFLDTLYSGVEIGVGKNRCVFGNTVSGPKTIVFDPISEAFVISEYQTL